MNPKCLLTLAAWLSLVVAGSGADFAQAVNELIPRLADPNVPARYAAQMQLQELASQASKPGNTTERAALGTVLAGKAADSTVPQPARVWIVRQLEYMGGTEAVPALTALLNGADAELRECARRALEKNSAPAASASLRAALQQGGDAAWRIGLVNSLGQRADADAFRLLAQQLTDEKVGGPAAMALAMIDGQAALDALWAAQERKTSGAADALIVAANRRLTRGDAANAREIFSRLHAQGPMPARVAALEGLIRVSPGGATELVTRALTGNEPRLRSAAVTAVANSGDKALLQLMIALMPKLPAPAKAQVLGVLDTPYAESSVIAAVPDSDESVRRAAIEALGRLGGPASVPVLLQAATDETKPGRSTAEAALARLSGDAASAAIEQAAASGDAKARAAAINALAARKHVAALPALLRYTGEADSAVSKAAYAALRSLAGDAEIEPLASQVLAGRANAGAALEAACQRAQNKPAAAKKLVRLASGDEAKVASLLEALSALGGEDALAVVAKLANSSNAERQNKAVRALGNWTDFAAAKPLLAIASDKAANQSQYALAMQGLARLVRSAETEPVDKRVELALALLNTARRVEEKKLALSALASVPHRQAAAGIKPLLADPELKAEACTAALTLAESLARSDRQTAKDLASAVKAATDNPDLRRRADRVLNR